MRYPYFWLVKTYLCIFLVIVCSSKINGNYFEAIETNEASCLWLGTEIEHRVRPDRTTQMKILQPLHSTLDRSQSQSQSEWVIFSSGPGSVVTMSGPGLCVCVLGLGNVTSTLSPEPRTQHTSHLTLLLDTTQYYNCLLNSTQSVIRKLIINQPGNRR